MIIKTRIRRWTLPAVLLLAGIGAGIPSRDCKASASEALAAGAISCAAELFQNKASHDRAEKLLRLGVAFDPDNSKALLMQARMERNRTPIADPPEKSVRKPYLRNVLRLAERTASVPHKMLLYRVVELLDPESEIALVALTKARNEGVETDFSQLLEKVTGRAAKTDSRPSPSAAGERSEGPNTPTPPTGASAQTSVQTCRDLINEANLLRALRRKRDADSITSDLGELQIGAFPKEGTSMYSLEWLNELNRRTASRGYLVIPYCNETFSLSDVEITDAGHPQFSGRMLKYPAMRGRNLSNRKLGHFLAEACSGMGTGYRIVDGAILLTAPEHAHNRACASVRKASDIVKEYDENHLEARKKYRNKYIVIEGRLSGTGRGVSGDKLMLDEDRAELQLSKNSDIDLDKLNDGRAIQAVGRFSHNKMDRGIIKESILISPVQY